MLVSLFGISTANAQYSEDSENMVVDSKFYRQSMQKGETINTDIFGYGGLILTTSVVGLFVYVKVKRRNQK